MNRTTRTAEVVARLDVETEQGDRRVVDEVVTLIRRQGMDGSWSAPKRGSSQYLLGKEPINPTADPDVLEVAMTGEKLRVIARTPA